MATNTNNYGFKKPEENDFYSIEDQNRNWDLADTKMAQLNSDLTVRTVTVTNNTNGYAYIDDTSIKSGGLLLASVTSPSVYIIGSVINTNGRGTIWFSVKDTNSYTIRYICIAPK